MAVSTVTVTDTFQQIGTGAIAITVAKKGTGSLSFNETASDTDALLSSPQRDEQFIQNEAKATFVRASAANAGWVLHVDGAL